MHYLARNLAGQLKEKVEKENLLEFGEVFKLNKVCMGIMVNGEVVTLEEFINGEFIKYIKLITLVISVKRITSRVWIYFIR